MLAQRKGEDLNKAQRVEGPVPRKSALDASEIARQAPKLKLSFKDKHALSALPAAISKLESEIEALAVKLADASLFTRDRAAFDKASARISEAQRQLEEAETQWLELEDRRAAIGGSDG